MCAPAILLREREFFEENVTIWRDFSLSERCV